MIILVPRWTDLILVERDGARAPKLHLNGGASKGLLSLRLERKSGPVGNRLDISEARRSSRSDVSPQWRRFEGVALSSIRTQVRFRGEQT